MNKGIDVAKGEYCNFMNSGDVFVNNNILLEIEDLLIDVGIVYGRAVYSDGRMALERQSDIPDLIYFFSNTISHQASFISTKMLKR